MKKMILFLVSVLASVSALAADHSLMVGYNGAIAGAGFRLNMMCIDRKWAWRDNSRFSDVRAEEKDGKILITASCMMNKSKVGASMSIGKEVKGWRTVEGKFTFAPMTELARCAYTVNFDVTGAAVEIDGRKVDFSSGKRGIVFYKKAKKAVIRANGAAAMEFALDNMTTVVERSKDNSATLSFHFPNSVGKMEACYGVLKVRVCK